jgi:hypothetical protein
MQRLRAHNWRLKMGTYRKEWECCGSVTETDAWEPESCPFCTDDAAPFRKDAERYRWLKTQPTWLGWGHDFRPDEVEREIDAAMQASAAVGAA